MNPYSFSEPEGLCHLTRKEFMTWRLEHSSQQANIPFGNGSRGYTIPSKTPGMNPTNVPINS